MPAELGTQGSSSRACAMVRRGVGVCDTGGDTSTERWETRATPAGRAYFLGVGRGTSKPGMEGVWAQARLSAPRVPRGATWGHRALKNDSFSAPLKRRRRANLPQAEQTTSGEEALKLRSGDRNQGDASPRGGRDSDAFRWSGR